MAKNKKKQQGGSVESYMGGLTDKGFNYNGAWGGTMQMGGNLPGAVGFTYARTRSIPSNGKYAKKTKASAEEGMEILPDPTDPDRKYKLSATIASAKDILNPLLRAKDPAKYDAWTKGRVAALREKGMSAMREYMEQNPISIYLSPQEVKTALSKQREGFYEDYIGAIRGLRDYESEIGTPMRETLYGGKEGQGELENLNYGWRFATLPVNLSKQATTTSGKPIPEDSFTYSYDATKDEYKKTPYYENGGKMMSYYQAGLDFEPKTISKKGSKIKKDNDGYWNPENWGKPVEIDSNEITMQGVYQPLLGISDTGDVQMMYPGEDYEFDGESVTEYPVAQNGVGIPRDIYLKQAYKESRFNPKAISPLGEDTGRGIAQISQSTYNDFLKATKYKPEQIDLMNPEHSAAVQRWAMNDLYNSEFINKPNQSNEVRLAKTLAAYNYGRGNLSDALVAAKEKGVDIYNSLDWMKSLPKETSDYINKIQLKKDDKFEKEYSEAVKKSPYTKYYKTGGNINQLDEAPLKKLDDLLNFTNMGKKKNIKKGQMGIASVSPTTLDLSMNRAMATAPTKLPTTPPPSVAQSFTPPNMQQMTVPSSQTADAATAALLGGSKAAQWYSQIKNAVDERKKAKVFKNVSEIVKEAATSKPDMPKRKYVRPEDNLLSPDQSSFQSFGTGYDILGMAREGMQVGGNLTEIQNMYNPGTLYDNLGYEPLEDSQMKQYKKGGDVPKAMAGAIMAVLPQIMEKANQAMDAPVNLATSLISRGTKKWTEEGLQNMQQGAYNQSLSNQFGSFMKDGGWVSHDWQPQVITKFGEYSMDQLLSPPNDAEMLRAGGNVRNMRANYMGDDEKLSMMAMGGNLQTHWGGKGEVMSYNPYMPGSGETVMLRGQSHEETDGRGNSGIGMSYGGNMVEAERGEPVAEMQEGGAVGDTSAVVFGNMMIPSYGVSELGDDKSKGRKFKSYAADLSKNEAKQNKLVDKATKLIDDTDADSPFDLLKLNAGMAMLTGADMKLKELANKKKTLAGIQNAILDTAEEMGLESDALARGKFMQAKKGAKIPKGQSGLKTSKYPQEFEDFINQAMELEQKNAGRGGGNYFGTNRKDLNTTDKAKEFYYKNYWKPIENLPPGLRTRALQLAINTGDPYGEILVASGKMGIDDRRKLINEAKQKGLTGLEKDKYIREERLKQNKGEIEEATNMFQKSPQEFMQSLDNEQKRYYSSLVQANNFDPSFLNFYDQYVNLANRTGSQFVSSQIPAQQQPSNAVQRPSFQTVTQSPTQRSSPVGASNFRGVSPTFDYTKTAAYAPAQPTVTQSPTSELTPINVSPLEFDFMSRGYNTPQIDFDNEAGISMIPSRMDVQQPISLDEINNIQRGYNTPQIDFGGEYSRYIRPMSTNAPAYTAKTLRANLSKPEFMQPLDFNTPANISYTPQGIPDSRMQDVVSPTAYDITDTDRYFTKDLINETGVDFEGKSIKTKNRSSKVKDFFNQNEGFLGAAYNELLPYIRPVNKLPLDPSQFMGEQLALATNTLEPVQAQTFKPMLETRAPKMSAQEALNKNQADFNALARQIGNNPAALSMLAAQKQAADRQTIAQVEATNIQQEMATNNRNIAMLNDASLKNLAILDTQYQRQAGAKANTKAQAQAALNSIASKIGQNKLENFQSGVMQNMYNYRFGPQGRIINYNPLAQFNIPTVGEIDEESAKAIEKKTGKKPVKKNGSIVKAIKNL